MNYLTFIFSNPRFLAYGFLMLFFSSFGQTYFIAESVSALQTEYGLSHGDVGFYFSGATLGAGVLMAWVGRNIDDVDLRLFTSLICAGLIVGCFMMRLSTSVCLLFGALFMLCLSGQGLMMHAAFTSMARYFEKERGKAMSLASLGLSAAQMVFPYFGFVMVAALGWRSAWEVNGIFLSVVLIPLMLWLLIGHGERHARFLSESEEGQETAAGDDKGWVRRVLLRDPRYYLMTPLVVAVPYIMTGLVFHRHHITAVKSWPDDVLPLAFMAFSGLSLFSTLIMGPLVDRFGVKPFTPAYYAPLVMGLGSLVWIDAPWGATAYMGLCGLAIGAGVPVGGSLWPQMYGVRHIGTVRAINSSLYMIATALAPYSMGLLFDAGISVTTVVTGSIVYLLIGMGLVAFMIGRYGIARIDGPQNLPGGVGDQT